MKSNSPLFFTWYTFSEDETKEVGRKLAAHVQTTPSSILALYGEIGAGKTTLLKGLIPALTGVDPGEVTSPTFTYLHIYPAGGNQEVCHFDLYRLKQEEEFLTMGFSEYFTGNRITCVEWAEKIPSLLPPYTWKISLAYHKQDSRKITVTKDS